MSTAEIAQLGERYTEDLKVPGSILGFGICSDIFFCLMFLGDCIVCELIMAFYLHVRRDITIKLLCQHSKLLQ